MLVGPFRAPQFQKTVSFDQVMFDSTLPITQLPITQLPITQLPITQLPMKYGREAPTSLCRSSSSTM